MWAASELRDRTQRTAVVAALRHTAREDDFWAVRRSAVDAISSLPNADKVELLKRCSEDEHSEVRVTALRLLGDIEDAALAEFLQDRFRTEDSYKAQTEALRALGKSRSRSSIPLLREAAVMESPRNMIRDAAEQALETIQLPGADAP